MADARTGPRAADILGGGVPHVDGCARDGACGCEGDGGRRRAGFRCCGAGRDDAGCVELFADVEGGPWPLRQVLTFKVV